MKNKKLISFITIPGIFVSTILPLVSCNKSNSYTITFKTNDPEVTLKGNLSIKVTRGTKWKQITPPEVVLPSGFIQAIGWYNATEGHMLKDEEEIIGDTIITYVVYSQRTASLVTVIHGENTINPQTPTFENQYYGAIKGSTWLQFVEYYKPQLPISPQDARDWRLVGWHSQNTGHDLRGDDYIVSDAENVFPVWQWIGPTINCHLLGAHFKDSSSTERTITVNSEITSWYDVLNDPNEGLLNKIEADAGHYLDTVEWINGTTGKKLPTDPTEQQALKITESFNVYCVAPATPGKTINFKYTNGYGTVINFSQVFSDTESQESLENLITKLGFNPNPTYLNFNFLGWFKPDGTEKIDIKKSLSELVDAQGKITIENRISTKLFCTMDWKRLSKLVNSKREVLTPDEQRDYDIIQSEKYLQPDGTRSWVGMERTITLNGSFHIVRVLGIEQEDVNESPKLTFGLANAISDGTGAAYTMKWDTSEPSEVISWDTSRIYKSLTQEFNNEEWYSYNKQSKKWEINPNQKRSILSMFTQDNQDLASVVKTVKKSGLYSRNGKEYTEQRHDHKLFILSAYEIIGHDYSYGYKAYQGEHQYQYYKLYKSSFSNIFEINSVNGSSVNYWTRTQKRMLESPTQITAFNKEGVEPTDFNGQFREENSTDVGVIFGFCI